MENKTMSEKEAWARVGMLRRVNLESLALVKSLRPGSDTPVMTIVVVHPREDGSLKVYPIGEVYDEATIRATQPILPTGEIINPELGEELLVVNKKGEVVDASNSNGIKPNNDRREWIN